MNPDETVLLIQWLEVINNFQTRHHLIKILHVKYILNKILWIYDKLSLAYLPGYGKHTYEVYSEAKKTYEMITF